MATAQKTTIPYTDPAFKYTGVWQEKEGEIVSYQTRSSLEFGIDADNLTLNMTSRDSVTLTVDGETAYTGQISEPVHLSLDGGEHTVCVKMHHKARLYFKGICINDGGRIFKTPDKPYVQFIGDSITDCIDSFSFRAPDLLGVDSSIVSYCGMALVEGWGWYLLDGKAPDHRHGMENMYKKCEFVNETTDFTDYAFKFCREPQNIVIYLGTNDFITDEEHEKNGHLEIFAEHYAAFVDYLLEKFPHAQIHILQDFHRNFRRRAAIKNAYEILRSRHDNIHFIEFDNEAIEFSEDGIHPAYNGYITLGDKMAEYLKAFI